MAARWQGEPMLPMADATQHPIRSQRPRCSLFSRGQVAGRRDPSAHLQPPHVAVHHKSGGQHDFRNGAVVGDLRAADHRVDVAGQSLASRSPDVAAVCWIRATTACRVPRVHRNTMPFSRSYHTSQPGRRSNRTQSGSVCPVCGVRVADIRQRDLQPEGTGNTSASSNQITCSLASLTGTT